LEKQLLVLANVASTGLTRHLHPVPAPETQGSPDQRQPHTTSMIEKQRNKQHGVYSKSGEELLVLL